MLLDLGIHCLGPMEHTSMDLGSRENFSNTLPYASFKICCKQGYSRGDGRHFTMVWNTAIRWPFCSPSHVSRTSGQILRELVWCGLRFWCKHEWTSVEQMASWRVWRSHLQTTVWRWQGPPTAALCGKHHMPPVLHPNIFLEESCFNEVLCKLQNYITITIQYLKGLIIGIQTLKFGGGGFKFKSLGSSGRNFWRCLLATLLRSPGSVLLAPGSLRSQFSTMISSTMVLAALKIHVFACFFTSRVITVAMRDPSLAGWLLNWCPGKELFPFWMMVAHICPAWVLQSTTNKLIHHAAAWQWTKTHHWLTASSSPSGLFPPQRCM